MLLVISGLITYFICEIFIRKLSFDYTGIDSSTSSIKGYKWECWKDIVIIVSPGYWLARFYKDKIKKHPNHLPSHLAKYIKANNLINLWFSTITWGILIALWFMDFSVGIMEWLVYYRFVSRCVEITYAFGNDAVNDDNKQSSSLNKYDRIRLALTSYVEIFLYSACVYLLIFPLQTPAGAALMSLGVGTFTNVGSALCGGAVDFLVYMQVLTTLSLVVLSLAMYVGRERK